MQRGAREKWAAHVQRWRASGLTAGEFARRVGINAGTLRWWSSRLKRAPLEGTKAAMSPLTFVEVTRAVQSDPIEVVLPSGVRLRIPPDFEAAAVERLLDVFAERR
jgi:hypothetical protein